MTKKRDKKMQQLFESLLDTLIERIETGEAKPADLAVARGMLADSNITASEKNRKLGVLRSLSLEDLPFTDGETG